MRRRYLNSGKERIDLSKSYFAIEALEDGVEVKFNNYYEYCIDDGFWIKADVTTLTSINAGQTMYFRAILMPDPSRGIGSFDIVNKCNLSGNIMSLLFGDDFEDKTSLRDYIFAFRYLFMNNDSIVDASQLILPATTLADYCYEYMFYGCTLLEAAPALPAEILRACCYLSIFYGCDNLKYIKMLATDISAYCCLKDWVYGVASSGTFVKNANMNDLPRGKSGIPYGWEVIDA